MPEERKLVTILFADVTGSTALGEGLDPEDLRALMSRYYDHARRIVSDHGGTLEKFIGDAVMASFGLPQAHSNDAERALATALALREAIASDTLLSERLILRMGANTGSVVATTDLSRGDFLVTGDAVNVAARVEQSAQPGEILASDRTATNAEASFIFGPARSVEAKGKSEPLRVFPLVEQRATRELGRPPLVGRERDLTQLSLLRDRTLRERRPQLVSIIAPAGTGKTRLLEEFLSHLFEEDDIQVATAHCLPYGQTLTYWPLRGLLEELLGGEITTDAVASVFAAAAYSAEDAQRLAELVLAALGIESGIESGAQVESDALYNAWRLLIESLARQAPRIIVFEDLHWASESLLDLVEHIMQPRTQAALLTVATSRPDLLDRRPAWGGGRRNFTCLTLEPLTEQETRSLIGELVDGAPEAMRAKIAERSGGNPYFAIELARGLRRAATLDSLPDTVQEAVQERLDALPSRERAVLQAAAVAGRAFRSATVQAALTPEAAAIGPATEVEAALDGLMERDLIMATDGGAYTFRHILVRDVAYNALARAERIRLHLVVARWLEDFAVGRIDEFVELIAYHYSQAAQLARQSVAPIQPPIDIERAVEYLERAAMRAFQAGALIEARGYLDRALDLAPESERLHLTEELADRSGVLSHVAIPAYRAALALWRAEPHPLPSVGARIMRKLVMHVMRWYGGMTPDSAQRAEMAALREEARRLAEQSSDDYELWRLRTADLFWYWWTDESPESAAAQLLASGWEAADHFESIGDWDAFSEALDGYGTLALMLGDWDATSAASQRRLAAPALTRFERNDALNTVIWAQTNRGAYAEAIATVRDLLARRGPSELVTGFASPLFTAREDAFLSGAWDEFARFDAHVEEIWQEAEGRLEDIRLIRLWQGDRIYAMLIALAREDRAAAERAAEALRGLAEQEPRDSRKQALLRWIEASLADDPVPLEVALGEATTAEDLDLVPAYRSLCRVLGECGRSIPLHILDLIAAGRALQNEDALKRWYPIARALADGDDARLASTIDDAEAHDLIPHASRMRIILAQRTGDRAQLERARAALERLDDRLFLRKLEAVAAALA